jgi:hypothetical protein
MLEHVKKQGGGVMVKRAQAVRLVGQMERAGLPERKVLH